MDDSFSRPWWILDSYLEHDMRATHRWDDVVKWWSEELSKNRYDGIIGLSQGAAMAGLLISMLNNPEKTPSLVVKKTQPIKFAILCSGFVSKYKPHGDLYGGLPDNVPTLHTVDRNDTVVPAQKTEELQKLFKNSKLLSYNEGHSIPVRGAWPQTIREFIIQNAPLA
ncbi:uncharacterized protein K441DRAFT_693377 [Cenococcum geophilum 1.58]|uniref:uncharacterized protein n=1 Tax=Cenococcum geophilum 1.58 TaxID=794803 RepID=UPI00358F609B|nr:hypothetical protein K441DRAFT_693377 [Cenococcum geophilum 1.58]